MSFCRRMFAAAVAALSFGASGGVREDFARPPESTRLQMWYHWVGDCVTREGLVRDFRAFGELGVDIVHIISPNMARLPKTAATMSPEWLDLFAFAIGEAKKNGVRLSFHNCPGWSSSGGPWITPENAMKIVVASEADVKAGAKSAKLPQPMTKCGFYRDVAAFALPLETPVFKALEKPVPVPIKAEGAAFAATYESPTSLKPSQMVLKFAETSFHADCMVEASADGRDWTEVADVPFRFFKVPASPKIVRLEKVPDGARFFRLTLRHAPPLPWVAARDLTLERVEFNGLPMIGGVERFNSSTSYYGCHPELSALGKGFAPSAQVDLSTGWTITSFDGRNAPAAPRALDRLVDWSRSDDPKLRYFSGRAVYERKVSVARTASQTPLTLDLGEVHEIANVFVDGKFVACLWEPPYRVTLPPQPPTLNSQPTTLNTFHLRLEIVNLMPNRMIGDAIALRNGAKEEMSEKGPWPKWVLEGRPDSGTGIFSWTNFRPAWTADDMPLASGLLGPVKLCWGR